MATYTDQATGTIFNQIRRYIAKGFQGVLTNVDNVNSGQYVYRPSSSATILALDIDWCGALLNGTYITTTAQLIQQINLITERFDDYISSDDVTEMLNDIEELKTQLSQKADVSDIPTSLSDFDGFNNVATKYYVTNTISSASLNAYDIAVKNGFVGTEVEWLASLHGANGTNGKSAYELAIQYGLTTNTEYVWLQSLQGRDAFSAYDIAKSLDPNVGTQQEWLNSLKGAKGDDGEDGKSAYEVAVVNGFSGTQQEWLTSLKGATGATGAIGKSAYEIAKTLDPTIGTEQEWLASLQGKNGKSAYELYYDLQVGLGNEPLSESDWINSISNPYTAGTNITITNGVISANITYNTSDVWNIINE